MKKNTMYILGGVAVVGLAYYLYNKNKQNIASSTSSFANLSGRGGCTCPTCRSGQECVSGTNPQTGQTVCKCLTVDKTWYPS